MRRIIQQAKPRRPTSRTAPLLQAWFILHLVRYELVVSVQQARDLKASQVTSHKIQATHLVVGRTLLVVAGGVSGPYSGEVVQVLVDVLGAGSGTAVRMPSVQACKCDTCKINKQMNLLFSCMKKNAAK